MKLISLMFIAGVLAMTGCVTSYEAGRQEEDADYLYNDPDDAQASSLFEMSFGDGDPRVTKNLPADAVNKLGDAVRSARE